MKFRLICAAGILAVASTNILADIVTVQPADSYDTTLAAGGWLPAHKSYTIANTIGDYIYWQASSADGTVTCQPAGCWIAPGHSVTITVSPASIMSFAAAGTYNDQVSLDFEPRVLGDIDGGGSVNVGDLQALIASWNAGTTDSTYNPAADLNGDGYVNVADIQILADHWATSYGATTL